jgi:hypothetical protein
MVMPVFIMGSRTRMYIVMTGFEMNQRYLNTLSVPVRLFFLH